LFTLLARARHNRTQFGLRLLRCIKPLDMRWRLWVTAPAPTRLQRHKNAVANVALVIPVLYFAVQFGCDHDKAKKRKVAPASPRAMAKRVSWIIWTPWCPALAGLGCGSKERHTLSKPLAGARLGSRGRPRCVIRLIAGIADGPAVRHQFGVVSAPQLGVRRKAG